MSYLVLARKWRPRDFEAVVGQEHVLRALINALDEDRLHHAFLFAGMRGVGKTTLARILAKAINCEQGVSSKPCGSCWACLEIDEGRFVDLLEVDAASRTRVDDTRELLDNVQYAPTRGRYKVYLIDEVHMLSTHSFNALLKTLEEPPPHVKFLLATTDPQKLPVTVLSRCLQFNLKRLTPTLIERRLAAIAQAEQIETEPAALRLLSRAAEGSMRDALSLLDQSIAFGGGRLTEADVSELLGTVERRHVLEMLEAIAADDGPRLMSIVARLDEQAPDYATVLDELATLLQQVALAQVVPEALDERTEDPEPVRALAASMSPEQAQLCYQIAIIGRRDLPLAADPRSGLEMVLLRMLAFRPAGPGAPVAPASGEPARGADAARAVARTDDSAGAKPPTQPRSGRTAGTCDLSDWPAFVNALSVPGAARQLAAQCVLSRHHGNVLELELAQTHEHLMTQQNRERLQQAISTALGTDLRVVINIGEPASETPAQRDARLAAERVQAARESLERDPNVLALKERLGASIRSDTVQPLDKRGSP